MITSGVAPFRPRARLIRLLGEELISDEVMAVAELVKNSYDADATAVTIRFRELADPESARIEIIDDGAGITRERLLDTWLEPATSFKRRGGRKQRTPAGRYPLGEKGVGRFAADKLGADLELVSRADGSDEEVRLGVAWNDFGEDDYLETVQNSWEAGPPTEFLHGGRGTLIRVRRLRTVWTPELLQRVHQGLARLMSPTARAGDFRMYLDCPDYPEFSGPIEDRLIASAPYRLVGTVTAEGLLSTSDEPSETIDLTRLSADRFRTGQGWRRPECGPFTASFSVWDLDVLGDRHTRVPRPLRALLKRMSGVAIYRDGFRVAPYGDPDNDWLELNQRRVNNPTLRVSTNQVVGTVEIAQEANPDLRDRTSREGLIDSPAFHDLKALVVAALSRLEETRFARRKESAPEPPPPDADPVLHHLRAAHAGGAGWATVRKAEEEYLRYRREQKERERRLFALASRGAAAGQLLGQMSGSFAAIATYMPLIERRLNGVPGVEQLASGIGALRHQLDALERLLEGGPDRVARFDLWGLAHDALRIYAPATANAGIEAAVIGDPGLVAEIDRDAALQALLHVLDNAVEAAVEQPDRRWVRVTVASGPARLVVEDSGPGVLEERRELVFQEFFTGRDGSRGLGLYFARKLMRDGGNDLVLREDGRAFELVFPRALVRVRPRRE